jgi:MoxR-like ATPase
VEDLHAVAPAVLRHRVIVNFDAHADGQSTESVLGQILQGATAKAR